MCSFTHLRYFVAKSDLSQFTRFCVKFWLRKSCLCSLCTCTNGAGLALVLVLMVLECKTGRSWKQCPCNPLSPSLQSHNCSISNLLIHHQRHHRLWKQFVLTMSQIPNLAPYHYHPHRNHHHHYHIVTFFDSGNDHVILCHWRSPKSCIVIIAQFRIRSSPVGRVKTPKL